MNDEELKALDKEVRKLKRIASEWAGHLHDLVEDRLPAAYLEIPGMAQSTFDACKAWAEANACLEAAQTAQENSLTTNPAKERNIT
jgi:hypothetical protein